jgi:peptidyl-prolyl cis-trans isomerase D
MVKGDEPGMAEQEAEKVMTKLRAGGDFAKLARKYSADETTKAKGGDLGFIEEGRMPAVFTEKAFALKAGEMAGPVKTPQGYHLIKVEEVQEPGTKPFEEVAAGIRSRIEREKAEQTKEESRNTAYAKAVDASLALVDTPDPEVVARARSLELREAGPFSETGTLEEPGSSREFTRAAFQTEPGSFSDIVEIPNKGYCIVFPKEKIEEKEKPLDAARDDIVKTLKAQKGREEAHALAVRRRAEVERRIQEKKSDFATACKELSITTEESGPFTSNKPIPGIGREPGISREAAVLQPGALSPVVDVAKGSCFFAITKREAPSAEETARGIENFRKRTLRDQEGRVLGDWSKWIHRQAKKMDRMSVPSAPEPPDEE